MQLPKDVQENISRTNATNPQTIPNNDPRYKELAKKLGIEATAASTWSESVNNIVSYTGSMITGRFITDIFEALEEAVLYGFDSLLEQFFVKNPKWRFLQLSIPPEIKRDSLLIGFNTNLVKFTRALLDKTMSIGHSGCYEVLMANTKIRECEQDTFYLIDKCKAALKARKYEIFKCIYAFTPKFRHHAIFSHLDFVQAVADSSDYRFADIIFHEFKEVFGGNVSVQIAEQAMLNNQVQALEYLVLSSADQASQLKNFILLTLNHYSNTLKSYYNDPDSFQNIAESLQNISKSLQSLLNMPPFKLLSRADKLMLMKQAIQKNQVENLRLLITYAEIDLNQKIGEYYLIEDCIKFSTPEIIQQLLLSGASVTQIPTALYLVAQRPRGNEQTEANICKIAQCLIQKGALINGLETEKKYPLHEAVKSGHLELVKLFLKQKETNLEFRDEKGKSALEIAEDLANDPEIKNATERSLRNSIYFEVHRVAQKNKGKINYYSQGNNSTLYSSSVYPSPVISMVMRHPQTEDTSSSAYTPDRP